MAAARFKCLGPPRSLLDLHRNARSCTRIPALSPAIAGTGRGRPARPDVSARWRQLGLRRTRRVCPGHHQRPQRTAARRRAAGRQPRWRGPEGIRAECVDMARSAFGHIGALPYRTPSKVDAVGGRPGGAGSSSPRRPDPRQRQPGPSCRDPPTAWQRRRCRPQCIACLEMAPGSRGVGSRPTSRETYGSPRAHAELRAELPKVPVTKQVGWQRKEEGRDMGASGSPA